MRKFKLLFVVLMASIFFMPLDVSAQNDTDRLLENVYQAKIQNDNEIRELEKQLGPNSTAQQKEFVQTLKSQYEWDMKALYDDLIAKGLTKAQIENYFAKRQKEDAGRGNNPTELGDKILATIKNRNASFSEEENLTNTLLSMAKSDERREALLKVYDFLNLVANSYTYGAEGLAQGHIGTERGNKEIALAEQIKKRLNEEGDITFGFLPGQREDDIVVRSADERVLGAGTKIRRKNGVLTVNNNGGMTLTMDDGTVFNGYFKEQVNFYGDSNQYGHLEHFADAKLLLAEEFTPYDGVIQYADGKSDKLNMGKSVTAQVKAAKAAYEAEMKAVKSELAKLSQKYGAATINSLKTTGALKVGYSMTMLNDYLKVCNRYRTARVKAENGQDDPLGFHYFEPTVSEVLKYGKTANRVKLGGTRFANEWVLANCMVANGKIAAIYQNTTILAIKDL
jgi:hypothetical protein